MDMEYHFYRGGHLDSYAMKYIVHAIDENEAKLKVIESWKKVCKQDGDNPYPIPNFTLYFAKPSIQLEDFTLPPVNLESLGRAK